jgi:hypothetical protein
MDLRYGVSMAEWISVYCRRQVRLDAEAMRRELDVADLWTLAEALDLDDDELDTAIESMIGNLRVESADDGGAQIQVHWKPEGRPIQISTVTGGQALEQIAETLEEFLPPGTDPDLVRIRWHLNQCQQVVNFEMGIDDAQHLGATIGEVLAFFVAETGDGMVWFFDRDWVSPDDRAATIWTTADPATFKPSHAFEV